MRKKNTETCECCGMWTEEGREKLRKEAKEKPIHRTDFSKPLSTIIEECRDKLTDIRGTLYDIKAASKVWGTQVDDVSGAITCGLVYLYHIAQDMEKWEEKGGKL